MTSSDLFNDGNGAYTDATVYDAAGNIFDPSVHQTGADGTPRMRSDGEFMRKRGKGRVNAEGPGLLTSMGGVKPAPKKATGRGQTDYRPGILGIAQLAAVPLSFTYPADATAIAIHMPPIAEALNDLAAARPEVAAALDKVLSMGPYGALLAACVPLAVQLLHNHNLLDEKVATTLGAYPKRLLVNEAPDA